MTKNCTQNKITSNGMKKLLLYIFILVAIIGLFGPIKSALAAEVPASTTAGKCVYKEDDFSIKKGDVATYDPSRNTPEGFCGLNTSKMEWVPTGSATPSAPITAYQQCIDAGSGYEKCKILVGRPATNPNDSAFEKAMNSRSCSSLLNWFDPAWCLVRIAYTLFYAFPAFILWCAAYVFNVFISITLSSALFADSDFISEAWKIVRDLSNIFFILILLYIAVKIILDIGGSEAKKMIAKVIIIALLINFSMFFTQVIIDSSNILALIFYNKISVCTNRNEAGECRADPSLPGYKDVAGGLVSNFDPTKALDTAFFEKAGKQPVPGLENKSKDGEVPAGIMFGIIIIAGSLMFFAAYALFVSGFSFLGRLIELWILIIFSPFAFMSSTVPFLRKAEYLGWDEWFARLLKVSFMAPIFMFFLYFIFRLADVGVFDGLIKKTSTGSFIESLLLMVLPALLILILLSKATKFAEKGSGAFGDFLASAGKVIAGVAVAGGIGAVAAGGQASFGHIGKRIFESKGLQDWETAKDEEQKGRFKGLKGGFKRFTSRNIRTLGGGAARSSFDLRSGVAGAALGSLSAVTGFNLGKQSKFLLREAGGYEADLKRRDAKRKARDAGLKVKEGEDEKQHLNTMEEEHQTVSLKNEESIRIKDREITAAEGKTVYLKHVADSSINKEKNKDGTFKDPEYKKNLEAYNTAAKEVERLKDEKGMIKNGMEFDSETGEYNTHNGSITKAGFKNIQNENMNAVAAEETAKIEKDGAKDAADIAIKGSEEAGKKLAEVIKRRGDLETEAKGDSANILLADKVKAAREEEETAKKELTTKETIAKNKENFRDTGADEAYTAAKDRVKKAADAKDEANKILALHNGEYGNSQNKYEDELLPTAKLAIKHINDARTQGLAQDIEGRWWQFWNEAARKKSAHDIRMGVKAEKSHGDERQSDFTSHVIADAAITGIISAVSEHGHPKDGEKK